MKIVFMGSADFGIPALSMLQRTHSIVGIVSTPPKPQGRGLKTNESPITIYAQQNKLGPILKPEKLSSEEFKNDLIALNADLFVVVAFRILPQNIFSIPKFGTINIHASLLPKYRGPAPIHRAIEAGETETGITIFRIDEGIDTGEIILQKTIPIGKDETTPELYQKLSIAGSELLADAVENLTTKQCVSIPQENNISSKAPKLKKEEGHINWNQNATAIFNRIRAFKPFPGTYCFLDGVRLGIDWAQVVNTNHETDIAGKILEVNNNYFDVSCNPGRLRILRVKPEGRKIMDVHDYLLGNRLAEGTIFK